MKDNFNTNFYLAAATVIPLLYITLFLQSEVIQNLARIVGPPFAKAVAATDKISEVNGKFRPSAIWDYFDAYLVACFKAIPALIVLAAAFSGIVAEALSLFALYYQADNEAIRALVLSLTLVLLILVSAKPTITIVGSVFGSESPATSDESKYSEIVWSSRASAQVILRIPGREPQYFRIVTDEKPDSTKGGEQEVDARNE